MSIKVEAFPHFGSYNPREGLGAREERRARRAEEPDRGLEEMMTLKGVIVVVVMVVVTVVVVAVVVVVVLVVVSPSGGGRVSM
mmetsp:Transcript_1747/g.2653  ORF Transcript_1747/g.2653 Transcript_1747/m.2653 type:complete len:83 (+) Transcript_1747:810-1058(+)